MFAINLHTNHHQIHLSETGIVLFLYWSVFLVFTSLSFPTDKSSFLLSIWLLDILVFVDFEIVSTAAASRTARDTKRPKCLNTVWSRWYL